jgi:hypothetical protein
MVDTVKISDLNTIQTIADEDLFVVVDKTGPYSNAITRANLVSSLATEFVRGDATDNGQVTIRVNDADFAVSDTTDTITNYIWRDYDNQELKIGTANAVITPRSNIIPDNNDTRDLGSSSKYFARAYIDNGYFGDNTGIGTETPSYRLDVVDTSGTVARFKNGDSGGTPSNTHGELVVESDEGNLGIQILGTDTSDQRILFGNTTSSAKGAIAYNHSGDYMRFRVNSSDAVSITSDGDVGIGTTSPSAKLDVVGDSNSSVFEATATIDDSNQTISPISIDIDNTGNNTQTANRTVRGVLIDYDATDTTSTSGYNYFQRVFQVDADISRTGDGNDTVVGVYSEATAGLSDAADDITTISGVEGSAVADAISGSTIGTMYGVEGSAQQRGASAPTNAYAGFFQSRLFSSATAGITNAYGSRGQITIDSGANAGITTAYGVYSDIVHNSTEVSSVITNGYLYRGTYTGSGTITNKWGVYVDDEDKNYFSGVVGIGTTNPIGGLHVKNSNTSQASLFVEDGGWGIEIDTHSALSQSDLVFNGNAVEAGQNSISYTMESGGYWRWMTGATSRYTGTAGTSEVMRIDSDGNFLLGGTVTPTSAEKSLVIFNGTAPAASVTNGIVLYAEDVSSSSELKVRDEAGNVTTLSPHNFDLIPEGPSEDLAWSYYSERDGKRINVDMLKAVRILEKLSGQKLVYEG